MEPILEQGCSESTADSSSCAPSSGLNDAFDPDAVDFEPLMVLGTGKILSYHTTAYYEDHLSQCRSHGCPPLL